MVEGLVFNIQKFSLHDGPGIRTVVFLKGCPLRCGWCANPESQSGKTQILWDPEKCVHCGECVRNCPDKAISQREGGVAIDHPLCTGCGTCAGSCPAEALAVAGEQKTVAEVLSICLQDQPFYEESGGGVTLSGGEPLSQPDFCMELLKALQSSGIHTAVETTGSVGGEIFGQAADYADLLLFDLKHWDAAKHAEGTGVPLAPILHNMKRAVRSGKKLLPRIPVIPGFNDSFSDADGFCRLLRDAGVFRAQLLPFHQFGERKYSLLLRDYAYRNFPALQPETLEPYRQKFLENGMEAFF